MNLVKFKDIILTEENMPDFTPEQRDLFNSKFKGKYTYVVNWEYVIALEDISEQRFIEYSRDIELIPDDSYLRLDDIEFAIDWETTYKANSVVSYLAANKYTTDDDITIDELKKFRTWLATYLLAFDQDTQGKQQYKLYDDDVTHMLEYYKNEMYDSVIKYLSKFSDQTFTLVSTVSSCGCNSLGTVGGTVVKTLPHTNIQKTSCGCNTATVSGNQIVNACDPVAIYRKNIYLKMVNTFSIIEFWTQFSDDFLKDFKKYVDGIIKLNLPLTTSDFVSDFADCGCLTDAQAEQQRNISILNDLSKSIQFMIDRQVDGHKNFILNSLSQWSSLLYENMRW